MNLLHHFAIAHHGPFVVLVVLGFVFGILVAAENGRQLAGLVLLVVVVVLMLAGCASVTVPVGVEHVSHIGQHFVDTGPQRGYDQVYLGLSVHGGGWSLTATDGYSWDQLDGRHEVFDARLQYDIPTK